MLKFPLGALPAGRNGLSASIYLNYHSKLLDSETKYFLKEDESCQLVGQDPDTALNCPYYQKRLLEESPEGGWQFGLGYSLKLIDRHDEYVNVPTEKQPTCSLNSSGYYQWRYRYKLLLVFPDGSTHEMRPNGWTDGNPGDAQGDYFDIRPDGYRFDCQNFQWHTNTITYYSVDGSFLRLDVQHDGNTAGAWTDNPWTLYFPDGSKVTTNQPNSEPQRFYDRNNNYVEFPGNGVRDQFNRSVTLSNTWQNGLPVHTITSQGFGQTLTWTITWKWISVLKNYWPCETLACDPEIQQQEPYGLGRVVIDTITLPQQAGSLTYTFSYNAPNHTPGQPLSASTGWGEISGITMPSGASVAYNYEQDDPQALTFTSDILRNAPTSKVLTYNQEYDGGSTPVTETWTYAFDPSTSVITAPDGGVTTTFFIDPATAFWNAGLTMFTIGPDGTKTETIWDRNNYQNPVEPTQSMTFSLYGLTAFDVQYWSGSNWVTAASVTGNNKVWRRVTFAPVSTTAIRIVVNSASDGWSRIVEVEAYERPNVAAAAAGASATASSSYSSLNLNPPTAINGTRATGTYWNDFTQNVFPDWLQVTFSGSKTIGEVAVFSLQDNLQNPVEPTPDMTFTLYGVTAFDVQYWNGSSWVTAASVAGNNKVWRRVTFAPVSTTAIRVVVNAASDGWSRIVELEAYEGSTITSQTSLRWLIPDHLGTPRMTLDETGALANMTRHDYLPFGEELFAPTGGRSTAMGYVGSDGIRQQFTSYERDNETGLDFAQARYFNSTQGRFTSVDPLTASATTSVPQSWNRYSYSLNSPLRFVDPSGLAPDDYYASRDGTIEIYETPGNTDVFYVESATTPGTFVYVAQIQRNAAGLVEFPANGTGFARYGQIDLGGMDQATGENVGAGDHYLQPIVAAALFGLTSVLNTDHNLTVSLGDMSSDNGSDPWQPGGRHHSGHGHNGNRSGRDIDFRYLNGNGVSFQSPTATTDALFSQQNNQTVFDTAATFGFTTNYRGTNAPAMTSSTAARGHNDHGHLGFNRAGATVIRNTVQVNPDGTLNWTRVP